MGQELKYTCKEILRQKSVFFPDHLPAHWNQLHSIFFLVTDLYHFQSMPLIFIGTMIFFNLLMSLLMIIKCRWHHQVYRAKGYQALGEALPTRACPVLWHVSLR